MASQGNLNNSAIQNQIGAQNSTSGAINSSTGANSALPQVLTTMGNVMGGMGAADAGGLSGLGNVMGGLSGLSGLAKNVLPFGL